MLWKDGRKVKNNNSNNNNKKFVIYTYYFIVQLFRRGLALRHSNTNLLFHNTIQSYYRANKSWIKEQILWKSPCSSVILFLVEIPRSFHSEFKIDTWRLNSNLKHIFFIQKLNSLKTRCCPPETFKICPVYY